MVAPLVNSISSNTTSFHVSVAAVATIGRGRSIVGARLCAAAAALAFAVCSCTPGGAERESETAAILTPPPPPAPRINGASVFGVRPGSRFLFQIAATGERPIEYSASNLPPGLALDPATGRITGRIDAEGRHVVTLRAVNRHGTAERPLRMVVGDRIALTPPMGWNSWNIWSGSVTQEKVRRAADAIVATGLRDHGWTYVNIDDGWQGTRGGEFNAIMPNSKFPDMRTLADDVHASGLKLGIYSSPWRTTFLGHLGSSADFEDGSTEWLRAGDHTEYFKFKYPKFESWMQRYSWLKPLAERAKDKSRGRISKKLRTFGRFSFVPQDVQQWAAWGIDYLKYDWVPIDVVHTEEMSRALRASGRDIVFTLSNNARFNNAEELAQLANAWRTSGDVKDEWDDLSEIGFSRDRWARFSAPGSYNDPDMLLVGHVGWGKPRPTRLTPNEQYTQISLWCLLAAPLLLGCDLEQLDLFTLSLLTNDEVLAINQDPLCKQATQVARSGSGEVFAKVLEDGSWAVGLFNRGAKTRKVSVRWSDIGISGAQVVRDLWRQQDIGTYHDGYAAAVPPHGVVLVKIVPAR